MDPVRSFDHIEVAGFAGGVLHVFFVEIEDAAGGDEFF